LLFRWARARGPCRLSERVTEPIVEELELRVEFGCQSSVAIVDERDSLAEMCQLVLQSIDTVTECVSFSYKALNSGRCFEEQAFNILDGVQSVDLSWFVRFAHHAKPSLHLLSHYIRRSAELEALWVTCLEFLERGDWRADGANALLRGVVTLFGASALKGWAAR